LQYALAVKTAPRLCRRGASFNAVLRLTNTGNTALAPSRQSGLYVRVGYCDYAGREKRFLAPVHVGFETTLMPGSGTDFTVNLKRPAKSSALILEAELVLDGFVRMREHGCKPARWFMLPALT
jgi:hypothetical protein